VSRIPYSQLYRYEERGVYVYSLYIVLRSKTQNSRLLQAMPGEGGKGERKLLDGKGRKEAQGG
jgi:hypothetical protein